MIGRKAWFLQRRATVVLLRDTPTTKPGLPAGGDDKKKDRLPVNLEKAVQLRCGGAGGWRARAQTPGRERQVRQVRQVQVPCSRGGC